MAIGVTADSFIVYFERIRDEVRDGRPLVAPPSRPGWKRARRTIIAADAVNFIAAAVLYFLASANVRGFAFTLGLTTLIDLLVVILFTHPTVQLLARTKFFGDGHKWSGLDPQRLGAKEAVRYRGRGRFGAPHRAGLRPDRHRHPWARPAVRADREGPGMINFAQVGNDLYTGKRSIDFIGRQKTWYALSAVLIVLALVGIFAQAASTSASSSAAAPSSASRA